MYKYGFLIALYLSLSFSALGQDPSFTYQGFLKDGANPANGSYDLIFALWTAPTAGSQVSGQTSVTNLQVINGVFTVALNFGYQPFSGEARYVEVQVRPAGSGGAYVTLTPRQLITSAPYSIKSFFSVSAQTATDLNGFSSDNFIHNQATQQPASSFNISGNGTVAGNLLVGTPFGPQGKLSVIAPTINSGPNTAMFSAPNLGPNPSYIHYGTTGDWYIRSAIGTGKVVLQDLSDGGVGIGTSGVNAKLHIAVNGGNILFGGAGCGAPFTGIGFAGSFTNCTNYSLLGNGTDTIINRPAGGTISFRSSNNEQLRLDAAGNLVVTSGFTVLGIIGGGGIINLCANPANQISTCSSSLRYKTNVADFPKGLDIIRRLRPVSFTWKQNGASDLGLVAEDVAHVEPLLTTTNGHGEIEGVKYDRIAVIAINAIKEQQAEIESLKKEIAALKSLLCAQNKSAQICRQ